jgi:hypothetical protein
MRIAGWVFIGMGTFFVVVFLEKAFVEGDVRWGAVGAVAVMFFLGWRLLVNARGIADAETASKATIELPMTPSAASVIAASPQKMRRAVGIVLALAVAALAVGMLIDYYHPTPNPLHLSLATTVCGAVGGGLFLIVASAWIFSSWLPARHDLRDAKFLRTSGPVAVELMQNGYLLRMADRGLVVTREVGQAFESHGVNWAVVDHSKHAHVILAAWDNTGKSVFLAEGYNAEAPRTRS